MGKIVFATLVALSFVVASNAQAEKAQSTEPPQTFVYVLDQGSPADELESSLRGHLPIPLVDIRKNDSMLIKACGLVDAKGQTPALPALAIFGIVEGFKLALGLFDEDLKRREEKYLKSLSESFSGQRNYSSFPLANGATSCLVVDRISLPKGGDLDTVAASHSTFVFSLASMGGVAFEIRPEAARIEKSSVYGRRRLEDKLNADVALGFTTITPSANSIFPTSNTLPALSLTFKDIVPNKTTFIEGSQNVSVVLPLSQGALSPTSIAASVTQSHVSVSRETQRIAIQQATRSKVYEFLGTLVDEAGDTD